MTTTTKPAAIIETSRGPKLLECPYCGETDLIHTITAHHRDFITYQCIHCEHEGYVLDLPDEPEPDLHHCTYCGHDRNTSADIVERCYCIRCDCWKETPWRYRPGAQVPVDLTIDDTHVRYGDIGPIAPSLLKLPDGCMMTRPKGQMNHCWGCDDQCKGINAGSNRPCPCKCH